MSSGVRVTVALVVIAFVAIGLYYASLDMPNTPAPTVDEALLRSQELESDAQPVDIESDEFFEEWEAPVDDVNEDDASAPEEIAAVDLTEEASLDSENNEPEETDVERIEVATDPAPADQVDDVVVDGSEDESLVSDSGVRKSLGVPSQGVLYGISVSRYTVGIDADEAIDSFDPSSPSTSPPGTAWVRLAPWVQVPDSTDQPWVVALDDEVTWVLVRDDAAGSMKLEGQVTSSRAYIDRTLNRPRVEFVLGEESPVKMAELTSDNIGRGLAIVIDGEVVFAKAALNVQGGKVNFLPSCDNDVATWIARRIKGEYEPRVAEEDQGVAVDDVVPTAPAVPKGGVWTVSKGDTLSSIAEEWFGDSNKFSLIEIANPGIDPSNLSIGDEIILPARDAQDVVIIGDGVHVVVSGETLSSISLAYYGKAKYWERIYRMNTSVIGDDPEKLETGMRLKMPAIDE